MQNSPEKKTNCPLHFGYISYAKSFLVTSDVGKDVDINNRVFTTISGTGRIHALCAKQEKCNHATCEYKQEILRALLAETFSFDPEKKPE